MNQSERKNEVEGAPVNGEGEEGFIRTTVYIPADVYREIAEEAKRQDRSVTRQVVRILKHSLESLKPEEVANGN